MSETEPTREDLVKAMYGDRRGSKFNVDQSEKGKEARTCDNIVFDSVREMECYRDYVKPQLSIGVFQNLQFQVKYPLHVTTPGGFKVKVGVYKADFVAQDRQGRTIVIEAKGYATPLYKRSRKHFEAEYGLRITEV